MRVEIYGDANQKTVSGPTVQFTADDAAPVTDLKAQITPSIAGYSAVTIAANGQNTNVSLTKSVYGGSADITTGVVTETHGGGAYNPTAVPSDLSSKIVSATTARSASGSVASFNCSLGEYPMSALTAAINPVQDLHGYDSPWPAGGGKNKLDSSFCLNRTTKGIKSVVNADGSITLTGTSDGTARYWNSRDTLRLVLPVGTYTLSEHLRLEISGGGTYSGTFSLLEETTFQNVQIMGFSNGETVNVTLYPQLEAGSTATTYSPYSNICPISGRTGADVFRTGVNVWDEEWEVGEINNSTGVKGSGTLVVSKNYIPVIPGTTFYWHSPYGGTRFFYSRDKSFLSVAFPTANTAFTVPSDAYFMMFKMPSAYGTTYNNDISINYPSTDHDYHAYVGTTYSVTFPTAAGTVYGGTLDVTTGKLTVDRASVDLGTLYWSYSPTASHDRMWTGGIKQVVKKPESQSTKANIVCSNFKTATANETYLHTSNGIIGVSSTDGAVYIYWAEMGTDVDAFATAMSGVQLVYELATPVEYTLTPQDIATILGQNNVWADTGDVTVSYRDGLLSNVSGIMTNSTALTTGENITYTLSQERTFQIPGTVIRTVVGDNVMSASTGNISVTWSSHWFDITPWIAYQGLTFSRNDVDSPDAGRDMSGYMHRGRVGVKEKMNVTTVQLTRAQSSTLQTLLYPETIQVRVTPYPRTNTSHTMSMYTNNVKTTYVIHRKNGEDLQSLTFPLIEN